MTRRLVHHYYTPYFPNRADDGIHVQRCQRAWIDNFGKTYLSKVVRLADFGTTMKKLFTILVLGLLLMPTLNAQPPAHRPFPSSPYCISG